MKEYQILDIIENYQVCYSIDIKCLKQSVSKYAIQNIKEREKLI